MKKTFLNDLKLRITETAKYIRPSENTMDFAFMFIPHEGIYYDLLSNRVGAGEENLIQRAAGKYKSYYCLTNFFPGLSPNSPSRPKGARNRRESY